MSASVPDKAKDPKRQPKPLVSQPLMNALRELRGMDEGMAHSYVAKWNKQFKGK
jgi:hypothetical protein